MRNSILVLCISFSIAVQAQSEQNIEELNFAGHRMEVPENCAAKSEYELLDCDGIWVQWLYLTEEMLETVPIQFIAQMEDQPAVKKKTKFKVTSFGSELQGKKFKWKREGVVSYKIVVYGIVNNQPLLLNIGSDRDIETSKDLNSVLREIIEIK